CSWTGKSPATESTETPLRHPRADPETLLMGRIRPERVAELIQREVTEILDRHLRDPRIHGVTVTDVAVTPDLQYATVLVSTLEGGEARAQALKGLDRAAP